MTSVVFSWIIYPYELIGACMLVGDFVRGPTARRNTLVTAGAK